MKKVFSLIICLSFIACAFAQLDPKSMELLDNMKAQLVKDEEKLLNEYNELLELAREKEIEEFPTID